jgi:hypothetical protein
MPGTEGYVRFNGKHKTAGQFVKVPAPVGEEELAAGGLEQTLKEYRAKHQLDSAQPCSPRNMHAADCSDNKSLAGDGTTNL